MVNPVLQDEIILLRQLADNNEAAFTAIYNQYWNKLYYVAHRHLKSAAAAEEIVQDVFMNLWAKRSKLSVQSLAPYLAAMTRYAIYHHLAKEKKQVEKEAAFSKSGLSAVNEQLMLDNKFLLAMIENLSNQLPEKCRLVFVQNKLLDQPLQQVAQELNISVKTAESHLTKALKVIRGSLNNNSAISSGVLLLILMND